MDVSSVSSALLIRSRELVVAYASERVRVTTVLCALYDQRPSRRPAFNGHRSSRASPFAGAPFLISEYVGIGREHGGSHRPTRRQSEVGGKSKAP